MWVQPCVVHSFRSHHPLFQYPQTDRCGCNDRYGPVVPADFRVSVSSDGSMWVQPETLRALREESTVSVSSDGSMWVQHRRRRHRRNYHMFQYPQTDRCGCNLTQEGFPNNVGISFSILRRIDVGATKVTVNFQRKKNLFQYPQTDRCGCNLVGRSIKASLL